MLNQTEVEAIAAQVRSHPGLVVLRGFDDATPEEFWLRDMTGPEFERRWRERDEFWHPVSPETAVPFGLEPPTPRPAMNLPGTFHPGQFEHYGADDVLSALGIALHDSRRHYYCHLCCNAESFLRTPDGRRVYHRGHCGPCH